MLGLKDKTSGFFIFINSYRWLTWLLATILLLIGATPKLSLILTAIAFTSVFFYNLIFTLFSRRIEPLLRRYPIMISVDIAFCFFLLIIYGWRSPFYLYSFVPVLVASYLWRITGGFLIAAIAAFFYFLSVSLTGMTWPELKEQGFLDMHIAQVFDYFLIAIFFSYPTLLMTRLNKANDKLKETGLDLENSKQRLSTLQGVSATIQSSLDVDQILKKIVSALIEELNVGRVSVGFFETEEEKRINWKISSPDNQFCEQLDTLKDQTVLTGIRIRKEPVHFEKLENAELISIFGHKNIAAFPLLDQEDSCLGIMIIDDVNLDLNVDNEEFELLTLFAHHTSIAIQNARLYGKSEELGIERERNRISMDMHDSVIQKLFGMRLIVDSCINESGSDRIKKKLLMIQQTSSETLSELRFTLDNMMEESLEDEDISRLIRVLKDRVLEISDLKIDFKISGAEKELSKTVKKDLYLAVSEAISNVVKHAKADYLRINLTFNSGDVSVVLTDDGIGFDYKKIENKNGHGLKNIIKRSEKKGWSTIIESAEDKGTKISIKASLNEVDAHIVGI